MLRQKVKEYDKHPLKTLTSTTGFGYVLDGKKKRFQDHKCRDENNC